MHSPVRSESDVFRGVVIICGAAILIGVLTAIAGTTAGAIAAAALIGLGIGALWMRSRGSLPERVDMAPPTRGAHRILVVANQTIEGRALLSEIENRRAGKARVELLLVCPALAGTRLQHLASDIDGPRREAEARMERSLAALRNLDLDARGVVGDDDPFAAASDALASFGADEVIISTLPPDRSRWLERGVVEQLRRDVALPITHVVVDEATRGRPAEELARPA